MSESSADVLKFVTLVEQHSDVLLKSQTSSNKEKKKAAALSIIHKWEEVSKTKLTDTSLQKKISNLKTRAKAALKSGKPMNEWHVKLLAVMNDDNEIDEEARPSSSNEAIGAKQTIGNANNNIPLVALNPEISAEQILRQFETAETKSMSIEQLQRFVLLQKLHVLTLQRKRLEYLNNVENGKSVTIDYIGFDENLTDEHLTAPDHVVKCSRGMCSDFDLHNLSYTISPSVDYHSFGPYYSSKNFNTPACSYVSEDYLHSLNPTSALLKPSHSSLTYSPVINSHHHHSNERNYLSRLTKRKQLFVNKQSEMQCNSSSKMTSSSATKQLSTSTYFDPESLVSFTLQSNANKKSTSKSTPCLTQTQQTSPNGDQVDSSAVKMPKNKRKSAINWPFKRSNSSSTVKQQPTANVPFSIQQHTSKTVSMLHKKLLSKSQSNLKSGNSKSPKSTTLSIMSNVTLKRSGNSKKQTIKLFGQSIGKLCLGDRHLIAPVKNMLIELMQRAPQTVGIFRKSANARVCRELKAELEQNPDLNLRDYPIVVIASVFKELLRSLPDCVLVGKMYSKWLEAAKLVDDASISHSDCTTFIRPLIKNLPKANFLLLQHFLCILHYIALQSGENKMSAENLAVCIGPSLLNHHDVAPASMNCELSKQVPKLISYLIKNCSELFGATTLTLFEAYQNIANENKENEMSENKENEMKEKSKDSGAEESDSLNSLHELNNNNISNCKTSNNLNLKEITDNHLHYQSPASSSPNTFSSSASYTSSSNCTPKIYETTTDTVNKVNTRSSNSTASSSIASISSTNKSHSSNSHRLPNSTVHQSYYIPMLSQQTPYAVNKVSLSNLSRDSGLTLSDTQLELYSPEEDDDDDDYHVIINQHLNLSKKLNNIVSNKCLPSSPSSNKSQFKMNSTNIKKSSNSTSLKKKCNNSKVNARLNATSSEEDDLLYDELEDVDIDELSEKSCASENCTPLYSRVYKSKHGVAGHSLTKSAPQLANIETISQSAKQLINDETNVQHTNNKITCTTIPMYLHSMKNNSLSTNSTTNSSCNSPTPASNLSSTSLNLSSSNEYSASDLQQNYFSSLTPDHLSSTPITLNITTENNTDLYKAKQPHIVTISAKGNSLQVNSSSSLQQPADKMVMPTTVCNVSINKNHLNNSQKSSSSLAIHQLLYNKNQAKLNASTIATAIPPSYQETMNRKEINARMANLIQANTSRKISDSEIDNLISKKIYEQSLRVYNADAHKDLTLRAVPVHVKNQSSSDSDSSEDCDQYPKRKITNCNNTVKLSNKSVSIDAVDGRSCNYSTQIRCKPIVQQLCAKEQTEYWKKDVNWSVATLRNKFTELCKQNECSTLNRPNLVRQRSGEQCEADSCKSIGSIYDLCKKADSKLDQDQTTLKPPINKLRSNFLSRSSQLLDAGTGGGKNCVTIIRITHGKEEPNQATRSIDSLSEEESYV